MDHLRGSHAVSSEVKTACLSRFFLPWTVRREIWTEALKPCNSGISSLHRIGPRPYSPVSGVPWGVPPCLLAQGLSHSGAVFVSQASDQAPGAIIYDCRPPILPVTVRLRGLRGPCLIRSTASSSLTAPPEGDLVAGASVPD